MQDIETYVIPERDVYRLIMRSKLSEAMQFEEWVVGTVLPGIRKSAPKTTRNINQCLTSIPGHHAY